MYRVKNYGLGGSQCEIGGCLFIKLVQIFVNNGESVKICS